MNATILGQVLAIVVAALVISFVGTFIAAAWRRRTHLAERQTAALEKLAAVADRREHAKATESTSYEP